MRELLQMQILYQDTEEERREELLRDREHLRFLVQHISHDFLEVNIRTRRSKIINYETGCIRESGFQEQLEWFADNMIVPEEREKYREEFEMEHMLQSFREQGENKKSIYKVENQGEICHILITYGLATYLGDDYILSFTQDISLLKEQEERNEQLMDISQQLLQISQEDKLTGLYNRSAGEVFIAEQLNRTNGVLLIVDIDRFKEINDQYGHGIGDAALKFLGNALRESFHSTDILCRWGGDEFLVFITSNKKRSNVESRIERLRMKIRYCVEEAQDRPMTISVGGVFAKQGDSLKDLFSMADKALYHMKQKGRDGFYIE